MKTLSFILLLSLINNCLPAQDIKEGVITIGHGQVPSVVKDKANVIHIAYGTGDSIMYVSSKDGRTFTSPSLVSVLPGLFSFAMRGPQVAVSSRGLVITACTKEGNIYAFNKLTKDKWAKPVMLNEVPATAKEGLMALSADGNNVFATWLSVNDPKGQKLVGIRSVDGGKTWSKNLVVYASPDKSICECCKPSAVVKSSKVYIMFRNWLNGNRDLYIATSSNGGRSFLPAYKLGQGSWKLSGCPMDGGGLVVSQSGLVHTVWRRESMIYAAIPGEAEHFIGEGRNCTVEMINGTPIYAWTQNGEMIITLPGGFKKNIGKGSLPQLKSINGREFLCVWEKDKQIQSMLLGL
ncbi:MAG TPA: sialidase family protein [Flavisolibacter sp.]|nr:sialidase family protein [Flavisolibacter sp.]